MFAIIGYTGLVASFCKRPT